MRGLDGLGGTEQEAGLAGENHVKVIEAVARGNGFETDRLKRLDGCQLGFLDAHRKAGDLSALRDLKRVAEKRRIAELLDQRHRELFKGIGEHQNLRHASQLIQELLCARQRINRRDDVLNLSKTQSVFL